MEQNYPQLARIDAAFNAIDEWQTFILKSIQAEVESSIARDGVCHIMLTGGKSAARLYRAWSAMRGFREHLGGMRFYFGDERCVPPSHPESNYRLAMDTLFTNDAAENPYIYRMEADGSDSDAAADRYAAILPPSIDVLLLSMADDGHIASLFPYNPALHEFSRLVIPVMGSKPPFQRLTITPKVLQSARKVFVMAIGEQKRAVYEEALRAPQNIDAIPARLVLDRTWIFGK